MRILLNVDESKHWHGVARLIGELARASGAHVTAVSTHWSSGARADAFAKARDLLALPEERFATAARPGIAEEVLPREAQRGGYDLVVVGRLGSLDWITNGLVASLLVRRIPTNVLIVRGRLEELESVLVCTAGPAHGVEDVRTALLLAKPAAARVTVMHVLSHIPLTYAGEAELKAVQEHFLELDQPEARHLLDVRNLLAEEGVRGDVKVRLGLVVDETLSEVRDEGHDLLVFGAHGTHGSESFLYEDIAGILARASPVSFLVVREAPR